MRRALLFLLAAALAAGCAKAPPPAVSAQAPAKPAAPFHGLGRLAFVRDTHIAVLDGETDTVHDLPVRTGSPAWSADGQWLSFLHNDTEHQVLDVATWQVHDWAGPPGPVTELAWAPKGHALAAATTDGIWLLDDPVGGQSRRLAAAPNPGALTWAPDGSQIAYLTTAANRTEVLNVVRISEGQTAPWYTAEGSAIDIAAWRPDSAGILFWVRPGHCNSCAADGLPLLSLAAGATQPVTLPTTLLHRGWLAWIGDELLMVRGAGRIAWDDKQLARCNVTTGACRDLPQPETAVSLDPAPAPDGGRVAVVRAERRPGKWGFDNQEQVLAWQASRRLWLLSPDGSGEREVTAAGTFISNPAWASDGRHLLYVADGLLRVIDMQTGESEPIITLEKSEPFGYYGQIDYSRQYAWHR